MAIIPSPHGLPGPVVDYTAVDGPNPLRLTVDYLFCDGTLLLAQGYDTHFLALIKLDAPYQRLDGKLGRYAVIYRHLSVPCTHALDEAWCCVRSDEYTYWLTREIRPLLQEIKADRPADLFDYFHLF